ncbi:hypothetical protein HUJ04_005702 [Dendroctonus ponderosae]
MKHLKSSCDIIGWPSCEMVLKMKTALFLVLAAAAAAATEVQLRAGITPFQLPAVASELLQTEVLEASFIQADVTKYAYEIVEKIQELIIQQGFDPMALSDEEIELPLTTLNLTNGWVVDLSTLNVSDSVIVKYSTETKVLELTIPLAFHELLISYDYHFVQLLVSVKGAINAKISNFKLNLHLGFNFSDYHAFVDKADVRDTGSITIEFTGLGLLDWIIDLLTDWGIVFLHGIILSIVDLIIQQPVEGFVSDINALIDSMLHPNSTLAGSFYG